jgi:hypothetical protein
VIAQSNIAYSNQKQYIIARVREIPVVVENLIRTRFIEQKPIYGLLIGILFSMMGILSASLVFGASVGLMSVAFTSILLIPTLNNILQVEENQAVREKHFSVRAIFRDHSDIFSVYLYLFIGIFIANALVGLSLNSTNILTFFGPQLAVAGITGSAFSQSTFLQILSNNLIVLAVCLVLSFMYGAGSIIFLTWNASAWGIIFGYYAHQSALTSHENPIGVFLLFILPIVPHMLSETMGYLSASIIGGIISKAVIKEKLFSPRFNLIMKDALFFIGCALVLIVAGAIIESFI